MDQLASLGVSGVAEQVYRYLLRNPDAEVSDAAAQTALDRDVLDESLDQLEHFGLIRRRGRNLLALDPAIVVERLVEQRLEAATEEIRKISSARRSIASLIRERDTGLSPTQAPNLEDIEHIQGLQQVRDRLEDLAFFTHHEVLGLYPDGALQPAAIAAARPLDLRCLRRGTIVRTIVLRKALDDPATSAYLTEISSLGARIRTIDKPLDRMLIYDREIALVPLDPHDSSRGALLVRQPSLVTNMITLFEKTWTAAQDLPRPDRDHPDPDTLLTETEHQVLAILSRTEKDESGAREMGISVRTFRRYTADLMLRLGAANRFQLALFAQKRDWI
ncbi:LuxR C-terminal-related transcriptional regulator [Streptomyces sp. NPDC053431]|uniref:LuxR C-terminal-related transcriptional regulator n=1 Tax=Streptomyces sp. NPDC053431 TaxID=3365703 RepID=UPI0037D1F0C5